MKVWRYVITHDTGFAPNFEPPATTLATCKPRIRLRAQRGDLIVAFNGERLIRNEPHSVRWAGIVLEVISLACYWHDPRFQGKKPTQYGGQRFEGLPDNIYRPTPEGGLEQVENTSHKPDNAATDTGGRNVLIFEKSWHFRPTVAVLPEHFNLRITGGRRGHRLSGIDEPTWRELERWLDDKVPDPGATTQADDRDELCSLKRDSQLAGSAGGDRVQSVELRTRSRC